LVPREDFEGDEVANFIKKREKKDKLFLSESYDRHPLPSGSRTQRGFWG